MGIQYLRIQRKLARVEISESTSRNRVARITHRILAGRRALIGRLSSSWPYARVIIGHTQRYACRFLKTIRVTDLPFSARVTFLATDFWNRTPTKMLVPYGSTPEPCPTATSVESSQSLRDSISGRKPVTYRFALVRTRITCTIPLGPICGGNHACYDFFNRSKLCIFIRLVV